MYLILKPSIKSLLFSTKLVDIDVDIGCAGIFWPCWTHFEYQWFVVNAMLTTCIKLLECVITRHGGKITKGQNGCAQTVLKTCNLTSTRCIMHRTRVPFQSPEPCHCSSLCFLHVRFTHTGIDYEGWFKVSKFYSAACLKYCWVEP